MQRRVLAILGLLMGLYGACWSAYAQTGALSAADVAAIRNAVQLQIDALANDDADSAFALATPAVRTRLGSPDKFLQLIKEQYDPVYRHQLALYSEPEVIDGKTMQAVRLTDLDSHVWLAVYEMIRDTDGSWKIDGCQLIETRTVSV
jgi:hypothetical protein